MKSKTSWTAIRVSQETKEELVKLRERWTELADRMNVQLNSSTTRSGRPAKRDEIGLDQVVKKLIRFHQAHVERAKKSSEKRRKAKQERKEPCSEE